MLDGTNHIGPRRGSGVGDALTVVRAEQLRGTEPIDAASTIDFADRERVPQQLPHSGADQVGHPHADRDVHADRDACPHRHVDALNGQAGREQHRGPRWDAADRSERESDVLVEWSDDQR
jgi:hypothetical protein